MDAIELRRRGVELLSPVLVPYGFVYQAGEVDRGSGGLDAHGGSHERTVRWNSECTMGVVRPASASIMPRYCTKISPAPPLGADKRDTRGSLTIRSTASATSRRIWFASGLSSSPAPPRSLQRLSRKPSVPIRRAGLPRSNSDRKSTRLNSSHSQISYAVFCLKKKKSRNYAQELVIVTSLLPTQSTVPFT